MKYLTSVHQVKLKINVIIYLLNDKTARGVGFANVNSTLFKALVKCIAMKLANMLLVLKVVLVGTDPNAGTFNFLLTFKPGSKAV